MRITGRRVSRLLLAAAVLAVLALVAGFVHAYRAAAPPAAAGPGSGSGAAESAAPGAAVPLAATDADAPGAGGPGVGAVTVTPPAPPGLVVAALPRHRLVLTVTSPAPLPRLGYLVPTSPNRSYGDVRHPGGKRWTLTTTVTGRPDYAMVFVQADSRGDVITCTIAVDGVVRSRESTSGPYSRKVCVA
jgi:hypothetical protein